jgi:hypothetical protein
MFSVFCLLSERDAAGREHAIASRDCHVSWTILDEHEEPLQNPCEASLVDVPVVLPPRLNSRQGQVFQTPSQHYLLFSCTARQARSFAALRIQELSSWLSRENTGAQTKIFPILKQECQMFAPQ